MAVALAQEDGGGRVPVRDGFDIHGRKGADSAVKVQSHGRDYMATFLDGSWQVFQDFRQIIVRARGKLGLKAVASG